MINALNKEEIVEFCVVALAGVAVVSQTNVVELIAVHQPKVHYHTQQMKMPKIPGHKVEDSTTLADACFDTTKPDAIVPAEWADEHNAYRYEVGAGEIVWDDAIAVIAQKWADSIAATGNIGHSTSAWRQNEYGSKLGENIAYAWGSSTAPVKSGKAVTDMWCGEKKDYLYGPSGHDCTNDGGGVSSSAVVGHYTQVIWAKSEKLGCGQATFNGNTAVWVCMYDPPGNYIDHLPVCEAGLPASFPKCSEAEIAEASGAAPPCFEAAGTCSADGNECCSCDCGSGAGAAGAGVPPPPAPPSPPPPPAGTGADGTDCSTVGEYAYCEGGPDGAASKCCADGFYCMQAIPGISRCLNPNLGWTMCPATPKYPAGSGSWTCAHVTPSANPAPCEASSGWCSSA